MEKQQKLLVAAIVTTSIFIFLLLMLALSYIMVLNNADASGFIKIFIDYHIHLMVLLGLLGAGLGMISYFGFTMQQKEIIQTNRTSKEILYRFLDSSEERTIEYILNNLDEKITQAKVSHLENMGKVKAHRTVQKLEDKKLIETTLHGKTKIITLVPEIKEILQ